MEKRPRGIYAADGAETVVVIGFDNLSPPFCGHTYERTRSVAAPILESARLPTEDI